MNVVEFFRHYELPFITEGDKHCTPGWAQTHCPFCDGGREKFHLGHNIHDEYWNCWSCGWHSPISVIMTLTKKPADEARDILKKYKAKAPALEKKADKKQVATTELPYGSAPLTRRHKAYLSKRGFDPDLLERLYRLWGTGPLGPYKHRIIAPIFYEDQLVSYQGRDITGRASAPYKACAQEHEARPHKHCLYGLELVTGDSVAVVEGITDVWRLKGGAVATFGVKFVPEQVKLLKAFKRRFILFDKDAAKQAEQLSNCLKAFDGETYIVEFDGAPDPGSLSQDDADALMRELSLSIL